jgi:hypothetical protein
MRYAPLHRLHSRELCLLRIRARARAWAGVAAPGAVAVGAPAPKAFPVFAKGWPAWAEACITLLRIDSSTGRGGYLAVTPPAKPPEERYWSTATRAAPVQMTKPGGGVPCMGCRYGTL